MLLLLLVGWLVGLVVVGFQIFLFSQPMGLSGPFQPIEIAQALHELKEALDELEAHGSVS